jgi:ADP-ribosylglycohydrolase
MIPENYLEKIYSGFLGMNIGIRLGAPVEPTIWTYERIVKTYGNITGYIKDFINFGADDDVNGPVFFLRALYDEGIHQDLDPEHVANAWLNYSRDGIGMFWWGGYGTSTEHTTYLNLKNGISAPKSGSIEQNGKILAEQIGGQIFIDTWGLVLPGNIERAARFARAAASVSHDGDGLNGAAFIAACISKAYVTCDVEEIISAGLSVIPEESTYAKVTKSVIDFYKMAPDDFRACRKYLEENWGYDKYTGVCHIIPNAGVCVLSLLYGGGDFNRTVEIATMCGWDTDCNAGNVGTIMGVFCGISGIGAHYKSPINDSVVLSGISGYLNILDVPSYAKELCLLGYKLAGEEAPEDLKKGFVEGEIYFDFELSGSTHNMRVSDPFYCTIKNTSDKAYKGIGALEVLFDNMERGKKCKIFYKPFYRKVDFNDERYSPVFSPTAYSGQTVSMMVYAERWNGESIFISPYVRNTYTNEDVSITGMVIKDEGWVNISFVIPDLEGVVADEIGIILEGNSPSKNKDLGKLFIDEFKIFGKSSYYIEIKKQKKEFGSITPFSHNQGSWSIEGDYMELITIDHAEAMTGNYFMKDVCIKGIIIPENGDSHLISARVQGALRGYYAGFDGKNRISILLNNKSISRIASTEFKWEYGKEYALELKVQGNEIGLCVDNVNMLKVLDETLSYGMVGYAKYSMGRTLFGNLTVKEL